MKTKIIIIALAAIILFSFTVASNKSLKSSENLKETNTERGGFELQDRDQF